MSLVVLQSTYYLAIINTFMYVNVVLTVLLSVGRMRRPIFAVCCKSLVGCNDCIERWTTDHPTCPKCRREQMRANGHLAVGIDDALESLQAVVNWWNLQQCYGHLSPPLSVLSHDVSFTAGLSTYMLCSIAQFRALLIVHALNYFVCYNTVYYVCTVNCHFWLLCHRLFGGCNKKLFSTESESNDLWIISSDVVLIRSARHWYNEI
jgi:hypothetical protein